MASLFDGKSLQGWRETAFTGRGKVRVDNGTIVLDGGSPMTGITWAGSFPRTGYEVRFEGARLKGGDFFASLTFPVGDSHCTWVTAVGAERSSDSPAWTAGTPRIMKRERTSTSETGRWYAFRLRVTDDRITAWIDNQQIINVAITGRSVELRFGEIKLSAPFGFASYATTGGLRKIEYRLLPPPATP